jgi:hypothetical protein
MDRGVPPIWPLSWVFDPKNKLLNDNHGARIFGEPKGATRRTHISRQPALIESQLER